MKEFITILIEYVATFIELCGVFIIIVTVLKELYNIIFKYKFQMKDTERDTTVNQGLASALEILLGAEILKTVIYRDMMQLVEVGALILIRVFITILIHWELDHKIKEQEVQSFDEEEKKPQ